MIAGHRAGPVGVAVRPPASGPGNWVGASSAVFADGQFVLAYRVRTAEQRGSSVVLARSVDGLSYRTVAELSKDRFAAESLERPALVRTDEGRWRLYLSCATPGSKHWRIDLLEAGTPEELADAVPRTVLPGDAHTGVKDPVVLRDGSGWRAWVCCHPLDEPGAEDRMTTRLAVSADGLDWQWTPLTLSGREGCWDARGARVTAVLGDTVFYDGRATAEENFGERTGVAVRESDAVLPVGDHPVRDARYLDVVAIPAGGYRLFYEAPLADGSHELRTELLVEG